METPRLGSHRSPPQVLVWVRSEGAPSSLHIPFSYDPVRCEHRTIRTGGAPPASAQVRGFGVCGATAQKFSDQPYWEARTESGNRL